MSNIENKDTVYEVKMYVWALFSIGLCQFIYSCIIKYNNPFIKFNYYIPVFFLFLFSINALYMYKNRYKRFMKEQTTYFVMFSLLSLGFYNGFLAFLNKFQIDFLLGTFIIIFGGILLINRRILLIIYCILYFLYYSLLFCFFSYSSAITVSVLVALFVIIGYSFVIQNAFIKKRQIVVNSKKYFEEQVKERTLTIEKKLSIIESKNKDLEEYAHVVSHDLKAPLRSIYTLINWFKEDNVGKLDNINTSSLDLVLFNVEKMDLLIKGILDYSSIDKLEIDDRYIDINLIIEEIIRTIDVPNNITIQIKNEIPKVYGNDFRFKQLFQNLIQNAIKYNDKENGMIEIGSTQNENEIEFYIKDNGIGINDKYQKKVFEIFSKLNNNDQSSGIGLSIVKKIIDIYEGKIWLESEEGKGTTFYFTIQKQNGTA
jgi:signal transduction histidine kinase